MESKNSVATALFVGLALCCAVMYITADGSESVPESVLMSNAPAKSVYGIGGPTSVDSEDVEKVGTVVTNTPDGRMRLTDYLTNVEKEIAAEEAARKRDVAAVRAQMARNFAFNKAARAKLNAALLKKMARNAKTARDNLAHAMRWVQAKFAHAAAVQNARHKREDEQSKMELKQIAEDKRFAKKQLAAAVDTQQRAMAALAAATNERIKQTDTAVAKNAAQIAENAETAKRDLDKAFAKFTTKAAQAAQGAAAGRSKLRAQLLAQDKRARAEANKKLMIEAAATAARFQRTEEKMKEDREHADRALKAQAARMDAALNAQAALHDKHFKQSVKDIHAARADAEKLVQQAETNFKIGLNSLTATINKQVAETNKRMTDLAGVVEKNKVAQAKVNANVNAETKRMIKLGNDRYNEHMKKDAELKSLVESNHAATTARMDQMSAHYLMELDAVRSTMKKNRAHATKHLSSATAGLYAAIKKSEEAQTHRNGELRENIRTSTLEIQRELREAKEDFQSNLGALTKVVVDNQKKFEKKFDDLTGIVRAEAVKAQKGRAQLAALQKTNFEELSSAVRDAVAQGEKRMAGVESKLDKQHAATEAALNTKISAEIAQMEKEANSQIEALRLNSKEARAEMRKELLYAVREMSDEAQKNLAEAKAKAKTRFEQINAAEDKAASESAAGRAALANEIKVQKKAAQRELDDAVATLNSAMLALKEQTKKDISKTNRRVDQYAQDLIKENEEVTALMKNQMTTLEGNIANMKKTAADNTAAAAAASNAGFDKIDKAVVDALEAAAKKSEDKFGKLYTEMAKNRAEMDKALAASTDGMNKAIAKRAALDDSRFKETVADIAAARKEASDQVIAARKDFATSLAATTSHVKAIETRLLGDVEKVSGVVASNRAEQAIVNRKNKEEIARIEGIMNAQQSESVKARGQLRKVLDENKRAAAEETAELSKLFNTKIAQIRAQAAANDQEARRDMSDEANRLYAAMAKVQLENLAANEAAGAAISSYAASSQAAILASKKDFSNRLNTLTNTVAANHKKVENGLEVLTGVIRDNAKADAKDRELIRQQNKAMGADMSRKIEAAITKGELRAKQIADEARANLSGVKKSMAVEITNTVEEYADRVYKTISGNHAKIADNYLSLKSYAVTASEKLTDYTAKGKGKNLSSLGDLLLSIAALSDVKPQPSSGLSPSDTLPSLFSTEKVKVSNKVTKINGMVNEFVQVTNACRQRWPMGLGKYLIGKLEESMSDKGVLQVDKIGASAGNMVFVNGHTVGLSNKLSDFESVAVSMGAYEKTLAKVTAELTGRTTKKLHKIVMAKPPEWQGN